MYGGRWKASSLAAIPGRKLEALSSEMLRAYAWNRCQRLSHLDFNLRGRVLQRFGRMDDNTLMFVRVPSLNKGAFNVFRKDDFNLARLPSSLDIYRTKQLLPSRQSDQYAKR